MLTITPFTPSTLVTTPIIAWFAMLLIVLKLTHLRAAGAVQGIKLWMGAIVLILITIATFGLRSSLPLSFSFLLINLCWIGMALLMRSGLRAFAERPLLFLPHAGVILLSASGLAWFTYVEVNFALCVLITAVSNTVIFSACVADIRGLSTSSSADKLTSCVFIGLSIVNMLRAVTIVLDLAIPGSGIFALMPQRLYFALNGISCFTATFGFIMMVNSRLQAQLAFLATRDRQTGAFARTVFFDLVAAELQRIQRSFSSLTLMVIDLDKFKNINDTWGHPVGDKVIADFVANTMATLRNYDLLGRYGGDEFMILLPDTTKEEAIAVAERIRVRCTTSTTKGLPPYSISVGLCCTSNGNISPQKFMNAADEILYQAKGAGRNRVEGRAYE
jgi:diguanylate cyclase (GGDEF)-like protein